MYNYWGGGAKTYFRPPTFHIGGGRRPSSPPLSTPLVVYKPHLLLLLLDMRKAFNTINIDTQSCYIPRKLHLTFTLTYHHPMHRFRSCVTQMTSPSHISTSAAKTYIQPYLQKIFAWIRQRTRADYRQLPN